MDVEQTQRVRRDELEVDAFMTDGSSDDELRKLFLAKADAQYGVLDIPGAIEDQAGQNAEVETRETFEFRLFKGATHTRPAIQTITLDSISRDASTGGFVKPERPLNYYFWGSQSLGRRSDLQLVAVTGEDVLSRSKLPCRGYHLPWKVKTISESRSHSHISSGPRGGSQISRRKRPGKRHRIAMRVKLAAVKQKAQEDQKAAVAAAEVMREKRTQRNREKKVKKKARDKLKTVIATNGSGGE